ncbi:MAG: TetR/AcrR family transcriptional regulator [Leptolyngbyaceae cyanobacterium SM1_4_3]|nr:TetR/AcrR family transcriptional regulator [Leptolyngbyaceae cyanobacterium SM1_4_3]
MPKIVDHNEYRKNLLGRAFDLFAQKGFAAVTMREIAQGLGVSTGTLYHYFPSKEALFEQLMHEKADYYVLMLTRELEGTKTLTEQVDALGRFLQKNEDSLIKEIYISVDFCRHYGCEAFQNNRANKQSDERFKQTVANFDGISSPAFQHFIKNLFMGLMLNRLCGDKAACFNEQVSLLGKMLLAYLEKYSEAE